MREVVTGDTSAQTANAHVKMGAARAGRGWRTRGTEVLTLRAVKCREHVGERQIDPVRFVDSSQLRLAAPMRIETLRRDRFLVRLDHSALRPRFDTGLADLTGAIKWFANSAT